MPATAADPTVTAHGAPDHHAVDDHVVAAARLLRALGHPARLRIVVDLAAHDRCVHELVDLLGLPQPTVSQHLAVLRAERLVRGDRVRRETRYSLVDHHVGHIALDAVGHASEQLDRPQTPSTTPTNQEHTP